ncbi:hypothetical protein PVK06_025070 [Gossypium arboreum]|uniref:Uncharacterized protein n=1 Tax=Gossypium arboreum TaxID=29729 RepID=A0ABR0PFD7_GOSAR|nr:hypothetical protein PVK06_025070 [Gossypium arboreum]
MNLGLMRLNSSKATKLVESSVRLSPLEEVSLASDLEEEVAMQTLKLGLMSPISVDTLKELPPMREGSFGLQELARFNKLLEKPVRLKPR